MLVRITQVVKESNKHLIGKIINVQPSRWSVKKRCAVYDVKIEGSAGNCIPVKHTEKVTKVLFLGGE